MIIINDLWGILEKKKGQHTWIKIINILLIVRPRLRKDSKNSKHETYPEKK